jgi:hypothetical protein
VRRRGAILLSLLVPVLVACDEGSPRGDARPSPTRATASASKAPPSERPVVKTRLPADLRDAPRTDIGLPRGLPTGDEPFPSALDDPPGRAVMSYRPVETLDDPEGWIGETLYLLGVDGRWRRLAMAEFGLREAWWPGTDMYGAGQVSPDGRRWATHVGSDVMVLDLRTGTHRLYPVGDGRTEVRFVRWLPHSRTLQAYSSGTNQAPRVNMTHLVDVTGEVRVSPYGRLGVAFEPDGTAVLFGRSYRFRWADAEAAPTKDRVPRFWQAHRRSYTALHGKRLSIVPIFRELAEVDDLLAVDTASLAPVARLVNRSGAYVGAGEGLGISYGWLDEKTLLTSTSSWLVTWTPAEGELRTVVRMPRVPPNVWAGWSASFALDLLRPPRRTR